MIEQLLSPEVQKFIKDHRFDDPFLLSLNTKKEAGFPLNEAIQQIQSYQKAKSKIPTWAWTESILWPPPISIEQASSESTARFKSTLIQGTSLVDLTGGSGVDTIFFTDRFEEVHYVEPNEQLCEIARHNFKVLGKVHIKVHQQSAEDFLNENNTHYDAVYIDPSRRLEGKKVFKIDDCSPNLYEIIPRCKTFSRQILIKLSPLVDISLLIRQFQPTDIWVVAVKNEVKEVLCLIQNEQNSTRIQAIDLDDESNTLSEFKFLYHKEAESQSVFSSPLKYLYEPNATILKAGAFKLIGNHFQLMKLHPHTHLYTSDILIDNFPGRIFYIKSTVNANKKEIQKLFPNKKVNVITRNYPLSVPQLKSKFGLKDGGEKFLIATTLMKEKRKIFIAIRT